MDYDFINTVSGYKGGKDLVKRHTPGPAADHYMLHLYPDSAIYTACFCDYGSDGYWLIDNSNEKDAIFRTELFFNKMKIIHFAKLNSFIPVYLDEKYVAELKNWDAEKYRQDLLK